MQIDKLRKRVTRGVIPCGFCTDFGFDGFVARFCGCKGMVAVADGKDKRGGICVIPRTKRVTVAERIRKLYLNTLTPIEAMNLLFELKGKLQQ